MTGTADSSNGTGRGHPISVVVSRFEEELKTLRDQPAWSMGAEETREAMVKLTRLEAQVAELQARVVGHGQTLEVEAVNGATSTAKLVGGRDPADPGECAPQDRARPGAGHCTA